MRTRTFIAAVTAGLTAWNASAFDFTESFTFRGNHAATINGGAATTVWWNEDAWDVRTDSMRIIAEGSYESTSIHGAYADPLDGRRNDRYAVGGDGGVGVGVMSIPPEASMSARLRNPMLITAQTPGVVEFKAPRLNTAGHWWEVSITPANGPITSGEVTAMPSSPGYAEPMDSINVFFKDQDDNGPCYYDQAHMWFFSPGFRKGIGGVIVDKYEPGNGEMGDRFPTAPEDEDRLFSWRFVYRPASIEVWGDLNQDGNMELLRTFQVVVPWSEVHVHLLGIAYGGGTRHPEPGESCVQVVSNGLLFTYPDHTTHLYPQYRNLTWKDIRVSPVKYVRTAQFPKTAADQRAAGWLMQDLRDTTNVGTASNGLSQPNPTDYDRNWNPAFVLTPGTGPQDKVLSLSFSASDLAGVGQARFVYDIRSWGGGSLTVNGTALGALPRKEHVPTEMQDNALWWERSIDVAPALLHAGANTFTVHVLPGTPGDPTDQSILMDRLHMELCYGTPSAPDPLAPARPKKLRFQ